MRCTPEALHDALAKLDSQDRRRQRTARSVGLRDFCSNDYLGLCDHPQLIEAVARAARHHGAGGRASHLVNGHTEEHEALEQELAVFTGRERALVFSTGYMANLGVVQALSGTHAIVLQDRLNHASLIDAARLAAPRGLHRYLHGDVDDARQRLAAAITKQPSASRLVVTDGVFSMDGDLAPLPELARLAKEHEAWLVVDDAHGIGTIGQHGAGCCEFFGLGSAEVPVLIGTFGKALGSFGAFVAGDAALIEWLALSRHWTPLHHLEVLSPERARTLLRAGANLHLRPKPDVPSPLERAQQLLLAESVSSSNTAAASLVVRAAGPWSVESHELFADAERARAVTLVRSLYHVYLRRMSNGGWQAVDLAHGVLPCVIVRGMPR